MSEPQQLPDLMPLLRELSTVGPEGILPAAARALAPYAADPGIRLFVADVEERSLKLWDQTGHPRHPSVASVQIAGSGHGRVYRTGQAMETTVGGHTVLLAPVSARSERVGVLELSLDGPITEQTDQAIQGLALLLGYLITAADQWTDEFHVARRRQDMSLAAEVQWNLLPLAAFASPRVSLAGAVEPAYDVGGDAFDYACGPQHLVAGIFDAMGHGLAAARVSALAIAAFRNARRCGKDLQEQARFVDQSVAGLAGWNGFVTGQLLSIDLRDPAQSRIVNAGHPLPYLQRGTRPPELVELAPHRPLGMDLPGEPTVEPLSLRPGDRLTLLSDGTFEARPDGGEPFGDERVATELHEYRGLSAREAARLLIASVRDHRAADLADDATLVIIDIKG
jgi:hypothetical protein